MDEYPKPYYGSFCKQKKIFFYRTENGKSVSVNNVNVLVKSDEYVPEPLQIAVVVHETDFENKLKNEESERILIIREQSHSDIAKFLIGFSQVSHSVYYLMIRPYDIYTFEVACPFCRDGEH